MFDHKKHTFLFKCNECAMILSTEFEEEEDLERVRDNKMILECPCGGKCLILRD